MARRLVAPVRAAQKVADLPPSLRKIVTAFQMVPDPMARYKQLLFYATKLEKLPAELQTKENKVEGCVSQVRECYSTSVQRATAPCTPESHGLPEAPALDSQWPL